MKFFKLVCTCSGNNRSYMIPYTENPYTLGRNHVDFYYGNKLNRHIYSQQLRDSYYEQTTIMELPLPSYVIDLGDEQ